MAFLVVDGHGPGALGLRRSRFAGWLLHSRVQGSGFRVESLGFRVWGGTYFKDWTWDEKGLKEEKEDALRTASYMDSAGKRSCRNQALTLIPPQSL